MAICVRHRVASTWSVCSEGSQTGQFLTIWDSYGLVFCLQILAKSGGAPPASAARRTGYA